jgi:hypothetical protein
MFNSISILLKHHEHAKNQIESEIVDFGGRSDFRGCVKNCKLFEEPATSSCNSAAMKIAPRKMLEANNLIFYKIVKYNKMGMRRLKTARTRIPGYINY